jgi:putative flavoprotein involved in K+ transport
MSSGHFDTIVIGGGQAGLAMGAALRQRGRSFAILEAGPRVGESWRSRWDSLRLFTPAKFNGLPGMPFPGEPFSFPTKDEVAAYLEDYAAKMDLPVRLGARVERLARDDGRFAVDAGSRACTADRVVVATGSYANPWTPEHARGLEPSIVQLHSSAYRNPGQVPQGAVLVVGAGNSGAEIAIELARAGRRVRLAGRPTSWAGSSTAVPTGSSSAGS